MRLIPLETSLDIAPHLKIGNDGWQTGRRMPTPPCYAPRNVSEDSSVARQID